MVLILLLSAILAIVLHELTHIVVGLPFMRPSRIIMISRRLGSIVLLPVAIAIVHPVVDYPWNKLITAAPLIWSIPLVVFWPAANNVELFIVLTSGMIVGGSIADVIKLFGFPLGMDSDDFVRTTLLSFDS